MDIFDKLELLTEGAKYDVACTSSGSDRSGAKGFTGSSVAKGICHSFSADGRCISLLKILMTNICTYDCKYCVNRRSNDVPRTMLTPDELADLTMSFYRRNYIEGLFLSSGVVKNANYTTELMIKSIRILREDYKFRGYIHAKAIPGADDMLIKELGLLVDRMSVNIELPSQESLSILAPDKSKTSIIKPMKMISNEIVASKNEIVKYRHAPKFIPAGQSTQMIVGASSESDFQILNLTESLYSKFSLKRVFFSAYTPVLDDKNLPSLDFKPPLLREHRLYQADWLLRFYGFKASELLDEKNQSFNPLIDPKANWALNHMEKFPIEINTADPEMLMRVPGIGTNSVKRILVARRQSTLDFDALKRLGVVLKRARFFITCKGRMIQGVIMTPSAIMHGMVSAKLVDKLGGYEGEQLVLPGY